MTTAAPAGSPLPDELRRILDDLDANERRAAALLSGLDDATVNWRPDDRSWSTAQCIDHLNVAARIYQEAMEPALAAARTKGRTRRGPIRPGWLERKFLASLEPPPKRKLPAPSKIVPALRGNRDDLLEEFRRQHASLSELIRASAGLDLGSIRFQNPFLPLLRFTVGTGLLVVPAHERRHLWQAEQLRSKPGFPGSLAP
jgi:hypothetical protein